MNQPQISKKEFMETENKLYDYFKQPNQIENMKNDIELLQKQIQEIEDRIQHSKVHVEAEKNMGIDYARDKIQTSSQGSYVENEMCNQIEKLIRRQHEKEKEIDYQLERIQDIERSNQIIHDNLASLSEESKDFIKLKYQQKVQYPQIFDETHLSKSAWFEKRNKLIENIADWFRFTRN